MKSEPTISAGFLPLTDCMLLVAAYEKGFAKGQGINLKLSKEISWANIRDHMALGHYDAAHMLAPMPIAFNAGLMPFSEAVIAPMALGLGGNAVTISTKIWCDMRKYEPSALGDPLQNGHALKRLIDECKAADKPKLRLGVVHAFSGHNLELRYWLSACGINPEADIEIIIVPPPFMPEALELGKIDGYCVGEPWNTVAVENNTGCIVTTKSAIWHSSPEKVLGVQASWAEKNPGTLTALLRALHESSKWCSISENHNELAQILSKEKYLDVSEGIVSKALSGEISLNEDNRFSTGDFFLPFERAATFPWQSHALWFYSQMVRWGLIEHTKENEQIAKQAYRPDIYRSALLTTDAAIPAANMKVEGALKVSTAVGSTGRLMLGPDGFFDDQIFDPDNLDTYLKQFSI